MDIATDHNAARLAACRLPALNASLARLVKATDFSVIEIYGTSRPSPGASAGGSPLVILPMTASAGTVNAGLFQLQLTVPLEALITGADAGTGTTAAWARVKDGNAVWWADASVSASDAGGEIQLASTLLLNGAYCRLTSAVFQG